MQSGDCNCFVKKAPYMKELIDQADPQKEASAFERTNSQMQLLSSNKITHYFTIWMDKSVALKKNILLLQKFDALNGCY